ncbi:MAG TPA: glycosyltransferase family 2 protein [Candidatus Dormibacteraeota bacterium]|nr:glycosyltransferase family 2 protein [Candidatus Dormibacteraeota bacterium]
MRELSFFFPVLNEEEHVRPLVARALEVLPAAAERFEIVIVDDGSRDRTGAYADELAASDARVRVVHHGTRRGYGGAIRSGIASSRYALVFFTDGDQQFDPADVTRLLPEVGGADAVIGYRQKRSDPLRRRFVGWCYNRAIRVLFGLPVRDVDCAFKLLRREVFARVPLDLVRSNGAFFSAELLIRMHQAGLRVRQVAVPHHPRRWGEPKGAPPRVILRAIRDLLALRLALWTRRSA